MIQPNRKRSRQKRRTKKRKERMIRQVGQVIDPSFESFGWKTSVQMKRGTSKITINKLIAIGAGLEKGQPMYCYIGKDKTGRLVNRPVPIERNYWDGTRGPKHVQHSQVTLL